MIEYLSPFEILIFAKHSIPYLSCLADVPSSPRPPTSVSGMTDDSLVLSWDAPERDGGSKIIEYIVEIEKIDETTWTQVGTSAGNCTNILVTKLVKDCSYEFRICARNEAGSGPWLETEEKIIAGRQISKWLKYIIFDRHHILRYRYEIAANPIRLRPLIVNWWVLFHLCIHSEFK